MALQAVSGQHKAFFPGDIYNGVLEVVTPDGRQLFSRPLGIAYDDGSNTVFIATLTNAVGYLVGSNQVVYRGAFGTLGDLICTYHRNGFESDAVFRQQPPAPGSMGLNPDTTTLQMVTEFFNTTDPEQIPAGSDDWYGLEDQTLKFGKLKMGQGRAFVTPAVNSPTASTRVYKSWLRLNNRKFLIEEVPLSDVAADLNALPLSASSERPNGKALKFASNQPHFPASHAIVGDTNHMLLASADLKTEPGFVLDYTEIDEDQTSITFQSGQTYLISGSVNVGDSSENGSSVIFQGGAVLKFTTNAINGINYDQLDATYPSPTDPPVILTSADDNRFGVTIPTSSGVPVILTNVIYLPNLGNGGNEPENLYFYYAGMGMQVTDPGYVDNCRFFNCYLGIFEWFPGGLIQAGDCQFINCCQGVQATYGEIDLNNCLFSQCQTGIDFSADGGIMDGDGNYIEYAGIGYQFNFQYITADHVGSFLQWPYFSEDEVLSPVVANSIFTSTPIFQSVLFFSWGDTTNQINSIVQYPAEYSFIRTLPGRPYVSAGQ